VYVLVNHELRIGSRNTIFTGHSRQALIPFVYTPRLERKIDHATHLAHRPPQESSNQTFFYALASLILHPARILRLWNWKSAWLSILLRGPIFLAATARRGIRAALTAVLIECFL
jgi:hypothetical protein